MTFCDIKSERESLWLTHFIGDGFESVWCIAHVRSWLSVARQVIDSRESESDEAEDAEEAETPV